MKKSSACFAALIVVASTLGANTAKAERFDDLKCYKVKEAARAFHATANLVTMETPSSVVLDAGCRITGKVVRYCTPVSTTIVASDANPTGVAGQELRDDFTCYRVKCPTQAHSEPNLTDAFGRKILSRYQTREVCVAAQ